MAEVAPGVAILALPAQGHVNPTMRLACRLARELQGQIKITFFCCDRFRSSALRSREESLKDWIEVVSIPKGAVPESDVRGTPGGVIRVLEVAREMEDMVLDWMSRTPYRCIIADAFLDWAQDIANKLQIPRIAFYTASTMSAMPNFLLNQLIDKGYVPTDGKVLERGNELIPMPGLRGFRLKDIPFSFCKSELSALKFRAGIIPRMQEASIVLLNTWEEIEKEAVEGLRSLLPAGCPCWTTDPSAEPTREAEDPGESLKWLDQQEPGSVVYVSFGSMANLSIKQLEDLFLGLVSSEAKFLLVVRSNLLGDGSSSSSDAVRKILGCKNGKIVPWAPQVEVLKHPSTALFVSHCGWNSTIEAIWYGVPVLTWPCFAEQNLNAKYVVEVWKMGTAFNQMLMEHPGAPVEKEEIEATIKSAINNPGLRMRAKEMQVKARAASSGSGLKQLASALTTMEAKT